MDSLLGQSESVRTPAAMTARVFADAKRAFSDLADEAMLERFAHQAVDELYRDSTTVTTFLPVLALRRVRDLLETRPAVTVAAAGDA
ncbi:MAG: hypothetical protein QOF01_4662 [Thermomicrobiales bacterium]|nr:hypothetical protein [Thermomicrobiales bacterium]MEA2527289.1 hypothetical protein [Thermomicrobiales bacterium]MEA2598193.1 hypothetical protein [Thermomicrobiales bacterium]